MSHYVHGRLGAVYGRRRRSISWRAFANSAAETVRTWMRRRRQRQELIDFMAIDYRAASDMGVTDNDARDWAERPFWRP